MKEWDGLAIHSHNTSLSGGVAVLFAKSFLPYSYDVEEVVQGRLLKVKAVFENEVFVFICVYAPTLALERMVYLDKLGDVLNSCNSTDFMFLGGDFNCTADVLDRNHVEPHAASRKRFIELIENYELIDTWRAFHKKQTQFSWTHCCDNLVSMARLDRIYCFKHFFSAFRTSVISPVGFSDHCMVSCVIFKTAVKPKSAYWHFNKMLLDDKVFKDAFCVFWESMKFDKPLFPSLQQWWDVAKAQFKHLCQKYTFNVSRDLARSMKLIENEILDLQKMVDNTGNLELMDILKEKKKELDDMLGRKAQGAFVRSRIQNVYEMDAPSKYFFIWNKRMEEKSSFMLCAQRLENF